MKTTLTMENVPDVLENLGLMGKYQNAINQVIAARKIGQAAHMASKKIEILIRIARIHNSGCVFK